MIQLERHIEILLLSNDCVIVPDFGGFMAHYVCARYDESENLFLPPLRTLGFNPQLRLNDSLLAQSYIEAYDISYPEAIRRIASEVKELKQHINEHGEYEFNDIGVIRLNDEGRYEFTPCEAGILTPELYGLNTYEMPMLSARVVPLASPADKAKDNLDNDDSSETERTISIKVSTLRNLAAACIAVIAIMLFPSQTANNSMQPTANSRLNTELLQKVMPKDITIGKPKKVESVTKAPEQKTAETAVKAGTSVKAESANPAENNLPEQATVPSVTAPVQEYVIVLASQVSQKNANNFVERLHQYGFNEARTCQTGKTLRVVFGSYNSESDAYNALRALRLQSDDFKEGWVMNMNH